MSTRSPTKFTPELEARIRKVHADNPDVALKDLASRFGVSAHALKRVIKGREPRQSTRSNKLTPEQRAEIGRRMAAGEPPADVMKAFGVSLPLVYALKNAEMARQREERGAA